ncbi:MlaC/ttg2D family ABC transporter substrate-binding protein [Paracandidimonas soli]|uniref:MlaC/ttg2D family ABC transporter substrate-binding protein n=1 Tax=Paracandidimonas soli TaxID=1917182 RepID=UPI00334275A8
MQPQTFLSPVLHLLRRVAAVALVGAAFAGQALAQNGVDPQQPADAFVKAVGERALDAMKADNAVRSGDSAAITEVVNTYILPYVNLEKTTRLAAGRHWRQATPEQQQRLVEAFKGTLIRTYSSAFRQITPGSTLVILPYRGAPDATDTVVKSSLTKERGGAPVAIDYRLEKTADGWKIYDLNVENIWLIQNYRNQFNQEINAGGIDGLIKALNRNA